MGTVISFSGKAAAFSMRKALCEGLNTCLWQTGGSLMEKDAALMIGYCFSAAMALRAIGDPLCADMFDRAVVEMRLDWRNFEHVMRNLYARLIEYPVDAHRNLDADD